MQGVGHFSLAQCKYKLVYNINQMLSNLFCKKNFNHPKKVLFKRNNEQVRKN